MPPTAPYPGHQAVAETVRDDLAQSIGEDPYWTSDLGLNLLKEMRPDPVLLDVTAKVSEGVTVDDGWDGSTSFYVAFSEGPDYGAHGLRSFKVTVEEVDHDDIGPLESVIQDARLEALSRNHIPALDDNVRTHSFGDGCEPPH
jgi:hypothetical protein